MVLPLPWSNMLLIVEAVVQTVRGDHARYFIVYAGRLKLIGSLCRSTRCSTVDNYEYSKGIYPGTLLFNWLVSFAFLGDTTQAAKSWRAEVGPALTDVVASLRRLKCHPS